LGGVVLTGYYFFEKRLGGFFAGRRSRNLCVAAAALLMTTLYPADKNLPALLLGFGLGYSIMIDSFPFAARGMVNGKKPGPLFLALRCGLGFAGAAVIYLGLRLVFPGRDSLFAELPLWGAASPYYELGRFVRYGLLGLWTSAGAPRVFLNLGLAGLRETNGPGVNVEPSD
jgi:hypothetical protein